MHGIKNSVYVIKKSPGLATQLKFNSVFFRQNMPPNMEVFVYTKNICNIYNLQLTHLALCMRHELVTNIHLVC